VTRYWRSLAKENRLSILYNKIARSYDMDTSKLTNEKYHLEQKLEAVETAYITSNNCKKGYLLLLKHSVISAFAKFALVRKYMENIRSNLSEFRDSVNQLMNYQKGHVGVEASTDQVGLSERKHRSLSKVINRPKIALQVLSCFLSFLFSLPSY
jgi:hypothetical protein